MQGHRVQTSCLHIPQNVCKCELVDDDKAVRTKDISQKREQDRWKKLEWLYSEVSCRGAIQRVVDTHGKKKCFKGLYKRHGVLDGLKI